MKDYEKMNQYSKSNTFLDECLTDHSRFKCFALNSRIRKGSKPLKLIEIF